MSEVLAGDFDLRVPVVTAVIDSYNKLSHSDVVVELVVSATGRYRCPWHGLGTDRLTNRTAARMHAVDRGAPLNSIF